MNPEKVRILMIVPSLRISGAERQVVDLANAFSEKKFSVHLLTFEKEMDLLKDLNRDKVTFFHFMRKSKFDISFTKDISRIIKDNKIDILHCSLQIALLFGFLGKMRTNRKPLLVCSLHSTINRSIKDELFDWFLYVPLMTFCNGIITVCRNQQKYWSRKFPWLSSKFITVHNGVDIEKYRDVLSRQDQSDLKRSMGITEDEFVALMVAEFRPEKGHEFTLQAVHRLVREGRKVKLILIGDGQRRSALESMSRSLGLEGVVLWLGYQKDPRPYLSISDVLVLPSFAVETFPLSVLEALSMGKPVIATPVGGIPEVVQDGVNGILIRPRDVESLSGAMLRMMSDGNLWMKLSKNARETVIEKFTVAGMAKKTEDALMGWLPPAAKASSRGVFS